ncbi:hypothetical protein phiCT9441A_67 (endogenous virus) [Clostridium phage phiCT9441A]|uniref:hypothetical protein n=1 Tax=Clostridium phage phiCT9441A TaxID=1567014 RepID=UPI0005147A72|nr:hypothetical protein [Clostridium tetani]YP_009219432.1 hypothetical protein phiCT9441A_67 [Clostridium phage phiCT9441A]AJA42679.1 hypothetical protein phiCT9441A_67 [Clostridium phage phiCT9441A]KGI40296.1 hypothetical protein LA33_06445 [Clostridium tetani ATCC 9441]SUY66165.1 Uncharacterised protein [Clostridium tetani]
MLERIKLAWKILISKGGEKEMVLIYVALLMYGEMKFNEVPGPMKEVVANALKMLNLEHLANGKND